MKQVISNAACPLKMYRKGIRTKNVLSLLCYIHNLFFFFFLIEVELIYNVVLIFL